jgi:glycosyltransferase involved in cell wall biosynthesis
VSWIGAEKLRGETMVACENRGSENLDGFSRSFRMRHLLHVFPSFALGGSQARLVKLVDHFGDRYRHSIVSLTGEQAALDLIEQRWQVKMLPIKTATGAGPLDRLVYYRQLLRRDRQNLLLTHNWGSIEWAAASVGLGVPHVEVDDGFDPEEASARLPRRSWARRVIFSLKRSRVVAPLQTLVAVARDEWKVPADRLFYIPNGVNPARYKTIDSRPGASRFARHPGEVVVGTLAGLRPEKRLYVLIEAAAKVRQSMAIRVVIAGSGPLEGMLNHLCRTKGYEDWVDFIGFVDKPEAALREFDVFALSSVTEQLPISMIEAMICALPVVATDVADVRASLPPEQRSWVARFLSMRCQVLCPTCWPIRPPVIAWAH